MKVEFYNDICRKSIHKNDKLVLRNNFEVLLRNEKQSKHVLLLLSHMLLFKYYRTNKNFDKNKQDDCLVHIEHLAQGLGIATQDVFSFMRNRSYFMQRALPDHFKTLLLSLDFTQKQELHEFLSKINPDSSFENFLVDNDFNISVFNQEKNRKSEVTEINRVTVLNRILPPENKKPSLEEQESTEPEEEGNDERLVVNNPEEIIQLETRKSDAVASNVELEEKSQVDSSIFEVLYKPECVEELKQISLALDQHGLYPDTAYVSPEKIRYVVSGANSNQYLDTLQQMFDETEQSFMLSSLSPPEANLEDEYYQVFLNGINTIAKKNKSRAPAKYIPITLLFGNAPTVLKSGVEFNPQAYMNKILKDVDQDLLRYIRLEVAAYNPKSLSWNHSKIIVIDGKKINVGGINLFSEYNKFGHRRPRDLAVTIENKKMARAGEMFIKNLLQAKAQNLLGYNSEDNFLSQKINQHYTHFNPKVVWNGENTVDALSNSKEFKNLYEIYEAQDESEEIEGVGHLHNVMSVPTVGLSEDKIQPSEVVAIETIKHAKKTLKISQQSILFMYGGTLGQQFKGQYSALIIEEIREAIKRNVKVQILISPNKSTAENGNSYDGMPPDELRQAILGNVKNQQYDDLLEIKYTCDQNQDPVPNHTKLVMADDKVITIGSHNSYDKSHAEYTKLIVGKEFGKKLNEEYWDIIWNAGKTGEEFEVLV